MRNEGWARLEAGWLPLQRAAFRAAFFFLFEQLGFFFFLIFSRFLNVFLGRRERSFFFLSFFVFFFSFCFSLIRPPEGALAPPPRPPP